jgi:hypothetical protein
VRDPAPFVTRWRSRTVAHGDSITFDVRRCFQCSAEKSKLVLADAATKARLVVRFVGKAEHLLDVATAVLGRAADAGTVTADCAATIEAYLASLLTCTDTLPTP